MDQSTLAPAKSTERKMQARPPSNLDDIATVEPGDYNYSIPHKSQLDAADVEFADDQVRLHRSLHPRVITMLGIAGAIGTGLFLASGKAIVNGGAVGAVLGYAVMGSLVGCMMMSLGEMSVFRPHSGSIVAFAGDFVGDSFAFAVGWTYWLFPAIIPAVEIVAASMLIQYWDMNTTHMAIYLAVMMILIICCNMFGSKWFGEIEASFGYIKVVAIVALIILGLVINLGGAPNKTRLGFLYWQLYPFNDEYLYLRNVNTARFLGFWAVLTQAAFSYGGIETIALAAGEAKNPKKSMSNAYKQVFLRIGLLYILSIFIISMCIPRNDPNLLGALAKGGTSVAQSPFVLMINTANISILPHIINAVVLTSAFSSANFSFFMGTRMLVALGRQGLGPKFLTAVTKNGTPYYGFVIQSCLLALCFLAVSSGSNQAFTWLSNLTTLCTMICWAAMCFSFIRFHSACAVQGVDRKQFFYRSWGQPYLAWVTMIFICVVIFFNGFATFIGKFDWQSFMAAYITLLLFGILYAGHRIMTKSSIIGLQDVNLKTYEY